jgi:hypothetical protein
MEPALVARIERSIGARARTARGKRSTARLRTTLLRLTIAVLLTAVTSTVLLARRRYRQEVSRARAELLETVQANSALLTADERSFMTRVEPWLLGLAASYEGDLVADELRASKALETTLARPSVYVRGPATAFGTSAAIADAASASTRDSFLLCLLDPPASRAEKVVASKVRALYAGAGRVSEQARRLHDAEEGLRRLLFPWQERALAAQELRDVDRLKADLAKVAVAETKRAAQAELLIAVMDEMGEPGPAELDGERAHQARVAIVDLRAGKTLLRARKRVDPNWLAVSTRSTLASAVDGCALALDVRGDVH